MRAIGSSPGKIVLLGEHSVVFGEPAIAAAIGRRLEVRVRRDEARQPSGDAKLEEAIVVAARELGLDATALSVEVRSSIPPACRARQLGGAQRRVGSCPARTSPVWSPPPTTCAGMPVESRTSSTVPPRARTSPRRADGHIIWFERGDPPRIERLRAGKPFDLVIAQSGELRSTAGPVGRLRQRYAARPELYGRVLSAGRRPGARRALRTGRRGLGNSRSADGCRPRTAERLRRLDPDPRAHDRHRTRGRALGAKLSGAGGGGVIIALAPERSSEVVEALGACGFEAFVTRIGAPVGEVEDAGSNRRSA